MGCLRIDDEYKGKIVKMGKKQKDKSSSVKNTLENANMYVIPKWAINATIAILGGCASLIIIVGGWLVNQVVDLNATSKTNVALITELKEDIKDVKEDVDRLEDRVNQVASAEIPYIYASADFGELIVSIQDQEVPLTTISSDVSIGHDVDGKNYAAGKMINETMLLSYEEGGKTVYFLGQFNENYHWDGRCITNAYNADGTLYGVCESDFNDGVRQSYKTVLYMNPNEWDYYERERIEENDGIFKNVGISASYESSYNKIANFTRNNVRSSDILYTLDFFENDDKILKQYYKGETSDRKYNDKTGDAYLIKFDADGTVNSLYVGQFVNGKLEDSTGNAWNIIYSENDGYYVCNTGKFTDNHALDYADEAFDQGDINKKIEGFNFDCELKWKIIE